MLNYFKSTRSAANGDCVEVAFTDSGVSVRDSKNPAGSTLEFTRSEWAAFVTGVRSGEFDSVSPTD